MPHAALLAPVARCPRCGGPLDLRGHQLGCPSCEVTFPSIGPVPLLVSDHETLLRRWQDQLGAFEAMMERTALELQSALGRFDLLPTTRQRLERIKSANSSNRRAIATLFAEAGLLADPISRQRAQAEARPGTAVVQYFEQALRDWGWPHSDQNRASLARLLHVAGRDQPLGKTLVLGAGASRLAYDLHCSLEPELTLALDIDPFALLVAHAVLFADGLALVETPVDPASAEVAAVPRSLQRPSAPPRRFACVLADAFEPPFEEHSFDTIVTPWFVDVVADDFRDVLGLVSELLRPGGRWLNDGALLYQTSSYDLRYSQREVLELLELGGFRIEAQTSAEVSYLHSPDSAHARTESVLCFCATKHDGPVQEVDAATPRWVLLRHLSVPVFVRSTPSGPSLLATILGLVDGSRCVNEITDLVEAMVQPPSGMTSGDIVAGLLLQAYRNESAR